MRRLEFWKLGLQNVLSSGLRSGLTVLGMAIGVAAILAVLTLGEAGRTQVKNDITRLGINQVRVTAADTNHLLNKSDGTYLQTSLGTRVDEIIAMECSLSAEGRRVEAALIGCDSVYLARMAPEIIKGELPLPGQWLSGSRAALVGEMLAKQLSLSVGEWFSADGIMLYCSGLMGACEQASQVDTRQTVVVPQALLQPWVGNTVHELSIDVPEGLSPDEVASKAENLLAAQRSLKVNAISMQVQAEAADSVLVTFVDVLKWVALICMLVGGIGVTNILLVSVRERRREIGVMQSLGATQMQICGLFLCEAMIYAITGGILGLLMGGALIAVAGSSIGLLPVVRARDCTLVFSAAVLLGLLSGVAPAASASLMKPVDALREE